MASHIINLAVVICAALPVAARAAFSPNGPYAVESFDGTTRDLVTWQFREPVTTSITQNGAITFTSTEDDADYTTRAIRIPVGGFVRATVRVHNTGPNASGMLMLTNNSNGESGPYFFDTYWLGLQFSNVAWDTEFGNGTTGTGHYTDLLFADNTPVIVEIDRDSATAARFRVYDTSMVTLSQYTQTVPNYPDPLYVSLSGGGNGTATFDDVVIPVGSAPEPAAVTLLGIDAALCLRRRR